MLGRQRVLGQDGLKPHFRGRRVAQPLCGVFGAGFSIPVGRGMHNGRIVQEIRQRLIGVSELYSRLLLVVGLAGCGKTASLHEFAAGGPHPIINIGVELSRALLDLNERQRILQLPKLLDEIVSLHEEQLLILDNTEILFATALQQDPLRVLQGLSRNRTIVASWFGTIDGQDLTHAVPNHPEYRRYPVRDLLLVAANAHSTGSNCGWDEKA
jgi:hypothetical protein